MKHLFIVLILTISSTAFAEADEDHLKDLLGDISFLKINQDNSCFGGTFDYTPKTEREKNLNINPFYLKLSEDLKKLADSGKLR